MNRRRLFCCFVSFFLLAGLSFGCASTPDKKDGALTGDEARVPVYFDKIPANSPYVYTTLKPFPSEVIEPYLKSYGKFSRQASQQFSEAGMDAQSADPVARLMMALLDEFGGIDSADGIKKLGISTSPQMAVYGIGWFPVMRMTLSDTKTFEATLDRIDQKSGLTPQMRVAGKINYRQYDVDGGSVKVAMAVANGQLIVGAAPAEAFDEFVGYMFGQKELGRTLADVNSIQQIQSQYELTPYGVGYINIANIVSAVTGGTPQDAITAAMLKASNFEPKALSEVCRRETMEIVEKAPRLVFGYTTLSSELLAMKMALEVQGPFAAELAAISAPIPGYQKASLQGHLFSAGLGVDMKKALDFANIQANRINSDPFECEEFVDLNQSASQAGNALAMMPQFLTTLRGAFVGVQDMNFMGGNPAASMKGVGVLGTSDPMGVFSQLRQFVPQLQNIQLKPDGVAVALPGVAQQADVVNPSIVMNNSAIGVSVGAGMEGEVSERIKPANTAAGTENPLLVIAYDYSQLMKQMSNNAPSYQSPETTEFMDSLSNILGLFVMKFYATDHALVMDYEMNMNPSGATP